MTEPGPALEAGRAKCRTAFEAAERSAERIGNLRLVLALLALGLVLMPVVTRSGTPWWGLIPVSVLFLALAKVQDRALERRRWAAAALEFFELAIARLEERWRDLPDTGADVGRPWSSSQHPADDLDLFGPASLFQLISRSVTAGGRRTLASWMAEPASPLEVAERQAAVRALAEAVDVRCDLYAAAATEDNRGLDEGPLLGWAESKRPLTGRPALTVIGFVQPAALLLTAALAFVFDGPREPFYLVAVLQVAVLFTLRRITAERAEVLAGPERSLSRYGRLIDVVERIPDGAAPRLDALRNALTVEGEPASSRLRRLERLVGMLEAQRNLFFALTLGPALLWELHVVLRAEAWRERTGPRLRGWLAALSEVEALSSLAAFAHERPDYGFPEMSETPGTFDATGLVHPLIDRRRVVENDLCLGGPGSVLLLSGSNMSGKSTLLRAVGLALVLARSGAPVPARRLVLSALRLQTSVRLVDSLAEGSSHFYAELRRLKSIVDLAAAPGPPLLYLLDEVLHGTNSRERYIGAVSVIRWLSKQGAIGIVTTHDLALANMAATMPPGLMTNAHLGDDVEDDNLRFDYRLRPGAVRSTNALALMRAVGIEVELVEP